ncbi:MAG: IPT/TIG domain-containing protein, partial [Candidatus Thermoplasmatota archaeon]
RVRIPAGAVSGYLHIARNGRISNRVEFNVPPPHIDGIQPSTELIAGMYVIITGAGFSEEQDRNKVYFNTLVGTVTSAATNTLVVTVPSKCISGDLKVVVGGRTSNLVPYSMIAPELSIVHPVDGELFTMDDDVDGNDNNGIQINVLVSTDLPDFRGLSLEVLERMKLHGYKSVTVSGYATFTNVTVYEGETMIRASYSDYKTGIYAEDITTVTTDLPITRTDQIVYTKIDPYTYNKKLFIFDISEGTTTPITATENGDEPSWHSDGEKVVFSRLLNIMNPNDPNTSCVFCPGMLFIADIEAATSTPIMDPNAPSPGWIEAGYPSWSPDGKKIAYFHDIDDNIIGGKAKLSVVSVDDSDTVTMGPSLVAKDIPIPLTLNFKAIWSPNSRYLLFPGKTGLNIASVGESAGHFDIEVRDAGFDALTMDWISGSEDILGINGQYLTITNYSLGFPVPVYANPDPSVIFDASSGSDIRDILYSTTETGSYNRYVQKTYLVDISTLERTELGYMKSHDWLKPEMPVYNSIPPKIKDLRPSDSQATSSNHPTITATITDDMSPMICETSIRRMIFDGSDVTDQVEYNMFTGAFSFTTPDYYDYDTIIEYSITATDCVDNETSINTTLQIRRPPELTIIKPAENGYDKNQMIKFKASLFDAYGLLPDSIMLVIDGKNFRPRYDQDTGFVSYSLSLDEGVHSATLRAKNIYSIIGSKTWTFTVDRTPPMVTATPTDMSYLNYIPAEIVFNIKDDVSGVCPDDDSLKIYEFQVGWKELLPSQLIVSDTHNARLVYSPDTLEERMYDFEADIRDCAGNTAIIRTVIGYDPIPPTINIERPLQNQTIYSPPNTPTEKNPDHVPAIVMQIKDNQYMDISETEIILTSPGTPALKCV